MLVPSLSSTSKQMSSAKVAVDLMLDLVLIPDFVGNARAYIAKIVQIFSEYPEAVMMKAAHVIPERSPRPTIDLVRKVLDELHAPILREEERERAREQARLLLPPPNPERTPEQQARIDALVAETRKQLGIPEDGLPPKPPQPPPQPPNADYMHRIAADLAARKARNDLLAAEQKPPEQEQEAPP